MYHKSQFNHEVQVAETGNRVIFNFRSKRLTELNPLQQMIFDEAPYEEVRSPFLKRMAEEGFLAEGDEYASLYQSIKSNIAKDSVLKITVCTTMRCNFACKYCIETGQMEQADMTEDVMDGVLSFVKQRLDEGGIKEFVVMWFGGEPLINTAVIERLSKEFIKLCDEYGIEYSAGIYTNGYLLNEKNIRLLEQYHVREAKISIDGTAEYHDAIRYMKGGKGSYDVIMRNLRIPTSIRYTIRCNLTRQNIEGYKPLVDELREITEAAGNQIRCIPERMRVVKEVEKDLLDIEIPLNEYYAMYNEMVRYAENEAFNPVMQVYEPKMLACAACSKNDFTVDVHGNLYKCNAYVGYDNHVVGDVFSGLYNDPQKETAEVAYLKNYVISEDERCKKCTILPICLGRCPYMYLVYPGRHDCHRFIADLDGVVRELYKTWKEKPDWLNKKDRKGAIIKETE